MTHVPTTPQGLPCTLCAQLADEEYASQKHGWEGHNTHLPAVV